MICFIILTLSPVICIVILTLSPVICITILTLNPVIYTIILTPHHCCKFQVLALCVVRECLGVAVLEVRVKTFKNPNKNDWYNSQCDPTWFGTERCDHTFRFCFDKADGSVFIYLYIIYFYFIHFFNLSSFI